MVRSLVGLLMISGVLAAAVPATARAQTLTDSGIAAPAPPAPALLVTMPSSATRDARPHGISPLMQSFYALTIGVQALDAHSTFRALDAGGLEGNPLMGSLAERRDVFMAVKAAIAGTLIFAGRDLSTHHKVRAIIALAVVNGVYAAMIRNNYLIAARMNAARP